MDRLAAMQAFVTTCGTQSFSGAARALGLSPTMVGKHVDALEARLGVRLLNRTTRLLTLTEEGRAYRESALAVLADVERAEREVGADRTAPHGKLRLNAPLSYGVLMVAPLAAEFARDNPGVSVEAAYADRLVDLIDEGWDLAIRIATRLPDTASLVTRVLSHEDLVLCATPAYLARRGIPRTPRDLSAHACLDYTAAASPQASEWRFVGTSKSVEASAGTVRGKGKPGAGKPVRTVSVPIDGPLAANNGEALRAAALLDLGLILQPRFVVGDALGQDLLREVRLDGYVAEPLRIFAVYPRGRHLSAKVRAFVDFAASRLSSGQLPTEYPVLG